MTEFIEKKYKGATICIDLKSLNAQWLGKTIDRNFVRDYPKDHDICGENGEYHSFVFDGPIFKKPVSFTTGITHQDKNFLFQDFL